MKDRQADVSEVRDASKSGDPLAQAHYQICLDRIQQHFWARDWQALGDCIAFPNHITSLDAERVVETREEWIDIARAARESFVQVGATDYHRICIEASFSDASRTRISGTHKTYILRNATLVLPVYHARMTMVWSDGVWRSSGLHTESRDHDLPTIHADRITRRSL